VSEGGVAGVGEVFRKLPWTDAQIEGERLVTGVPAEDFPRLEQLAKDEWPGR
jgi:hypothetical protein